MNPYVNHFSENDIGVIEFGNPKEIPYQRIY